MAPALFNNAVVHNTMVEPFVEKVIGGIQTAECIDTTCRRAFSLGYKVTLIKNGHTTFDTQHLRAEQIIAHHNQIIANWFGEVIESENLEF